MRVVEKVREPAPDLPAHGYAVNVQTGQAAKLRNAANGIKVYREGEWKIKAMQMAHDCFQKQPNGNQLRIFCVV